MTNTNPSTFEPIKAAHRANHRLRIASQTRGHAIALLTHRIEFHYWPRLGAFMIACVTAGFGLLFSAILWRVGMESMAWRYPFAVVLSYGVLLLLLFSWSRRDWGDWSDPNLWPNSSGSNSGSCESAGSCRESAAYSGEGGDFGGAGASGSFDAIGDEAGSAAADAVGTGFQVAVSAEEGAVITIPLFLIFVLLLCFGGFAFGLVSLIWTAPSLLAQLMIDAGTAGLLMVYVSPTQREHWLATATRKTLPSFLFLTAVFALAGYALEWFDPSAITMFDVWMNQM
jgi:hypothetical protein